MEECKESAVILPYQDTTILMQLRDNKQGILYPGHWGFFGGSIEPDETPLQCATRELYEELRYTTNNILPLSIDKIHVPYEIRLYSFACPLTVGVEELTLCEGFDVGLFRLEDIQSRWMLSPKANKLYPVIGQSCIEGLARKLVQRITSDAHDCKSILSESFYDHERH